MEPSALNRFLDQFLAMADTGFGLIQGEVGYVLNALIVISITLAGANWALSGEAPMAGFFRKVLFVGLFAFLVNNWASLSAIIARSGAELGLRAGGGGLSLSELHDPGRVGAIGVELFGRTIALAEGMDVFSDAPAMAAIFLAALGVALGFFVLALQLFVSLIAFKLGALAAFVALPWGVFNGTAWVAERPLGWVAGCAIRLFILALIASIAIAFVDTLPQTFTLEAGGALYVLLFGLTVLALAWFAPALASEVVQGQPNLSGSDVVRTANAAMLSAAGNAYVVSNTLRAAGGLIVAGARMAGVGKSGRNRTDARAAAPPIDYARMRPPRRSSQGSSPRSTT